MNKYHLTLKKRKLRLNMVTQQNWTLTGLIYLQRDSSVAVLHVTKDTGRKVPGRAT